MISMRLFIPARGLMSPCLLSESGLGEGGKDTDTGGSFHARTHDTFLCVRGTMKVWENDECRILGPGDFASVPPVRFSKQLNCRY
jgi:hypothetical protein